MDDETYFRRQGFWLRMARERAGKSQKGAALELGLSEKSKSTVSDYESGNPDKAPSQRTLRILARWYGVPVELFVSPPPTAFEVIEQLLDEASRAGEAAERRDWEAGEGRAPEAGDGPGDAPGRLSA